MRRVIWLLFDVGLLCAISAASACSRDAHHDPAITPPATPVRAACDELADVARANGAADVRVVDTPLNAEPASHTPARQGCNVQVDSFQAVDGAPSDLFRRGMPRVVYMDSAPKTGWYWFPFEGNSVSSYAISRPGAQCDIDFAPRAGERPTKSFEAVRATRFEISCDGG